MVKSRPNRIIFPSIAIIKIKSRIIKLLLFGSGHLRPPGHNLQVVVYGVRNAPYSIETCHYKTAFFALVK